MVRYKSFGQLYIINFKLPLLRRRGVVIVTVGGGSSPLPSLFPEADAAVERQG